MTKEVCLEVMTNGAIYVDGTRITNRSTKWGILYTEWSTECKREDVLGVLTENGYERHFRLIDDEEYAEELAQRRMETK